MNGLFDRVKSMIPEDFFFSWDAKIEAISRTEIICFAVLAAAGLLLCLLGLKIVRVWSAVLGVSAGFFGAAAVLHQTDAGGMAVLIAGAIAGIILGFLGAFFFRFGVFLTVFLSVAGIYMQVIQPEEYLSAGIGLAVALILAALAVRFVVALTIFATSVWGGIVAGTSVYQLVPVQGKMISILFCVIFAVLGILVQLLLESRKRKRRNLEKAAEIRETHSTENEIEKARSLIDDLDTMPEEESVESEEQDIEIIDLGGDEDDEE